MSIPKRSANRRDLLKGAVAAAGSAHLLTAKPVAAIGADDPAKASAPNLVTRENQKRGSKDWQLTRVSRTLAGGVFPPPPTHEIGHRLVIGSVLFGMGWGLAGLCPGPSIASLSYGGIGGLIFLAAMLVGMGAAPAIGNRLDRLAEPA